jgi:ubiquinone/menaquinone biosynthesis C-methylase UbiE
MILTMDYSRTKQAGRSTAPADNPGYLDVRTMDRLTALTSSLKQRITGLLDIQPGDRVLDVGCGPGTDTIPMAALVGDGGAVDGVDYDQAMVDEANARAVRSTASGRVRHVVADASSLPFDSDAFNACRCERLLQHVIDGDAVLKELVRVTKPDGRIVVADSDWGSLSIDTPEIDIERRVVRCLASLINNGYVGRKLFRMFTTQRLTDLRAFAYPIIWTDYAVFRATTLALPRLNEKLIASKAVSEPELQRFLASLEQANRQRMFFAAGNILVVAGRK